MRIEIEVSLGHAWNYVAETHRIAHRNYTAAHCNSTATQITATCWNTLQSTCPPRIESKSRANYTATHCTTLQHSSLQHTATFCNTLRSHTSTRTPNCAHEHTRTTPQHTDRYKHTLNTHTPSLHAGERKRQYVSNERYYHEDLQTVTNDDQTKFYTFTLNAEI